MASFHGLRPSDLSRFLHITLRDVRYLVSEQALHQVFDAYGATKVQMCADMTTVVSFPSMLQATRAGLDMQGRCIYTNCCWMQIQYAPAELVAPATGAVARESPPPASTPAAAPQSASISAASAGATPTLVCVRASPASSPSALTAADEEKPVMMSWAELQAELERVLAKIAPIDDRDAAVISSPSTTTTTPTPSALVPAPATPVVMRLSVVPELPMPTPATCSTECRDVIPNQCEEHRASPNIKLEGKVLRPLPWPSCSDVHVEGDEAVGDSVLTHIGSSSLYQFNGVGPFYQKLMEYHVALASTYPAICAEQVAIEDGLLGSFSHVQRIFHPSYQEESEYLSPATELVPYHRAPVPVTAGVVFPLGSVSLWEFARFSLYDILRMIQNTCELCSCILRAWTAVSLLFATGNSTMKGPTEQWDPGISRIFHIFIQHCPVSSHLISIAVTKVRTYSTLLQHEFQFSTDHPFLVEGNEFKYSVLAPWQVVCPLYLLQATGSVLAINSPSLLDYLLQSCDAGHGCFGGSAYVSCEVLTIGNQKLMDDIFDNVDMLSSVHAVQFLNSQSSLNHAIVWRNRTVWFDHSATTAIIWLFHLLELVRSSEQAEAKGRRNDAATAYYRGHRLDHAYFFDKVCADHDYYIDLFLESVRAAGYLNIVKFCLDYDTHRDLGVVMKPQVPWDPGGSTWHRLEVKPNFKEGGMLATNLPSPGLGLALLGLGCTGGIDYKYRVNTYEQIGLD